MTDVAKAGPYCPIVSHVSLAATKCRKQKDTIKKINASLHTLIFFKIHLLKEYAHNIYKPNIYFLIGGKLVPTYKK
jgi:hypothetical protein